MNIAVLFDLDGTLIDSLPNLTDAANAVLAERHLPPLNAATVAGFVGLGEQVFVDRLMAATGLAVNERPWVMATFLARYREEARHTKCFHGARRAVLAIRNAGLSVGLVTNKPRAPLDTTLVASGLQDSFDIVVAGDDLPKRKPDPLPILHAMEALKTSTCIYVGDSEIDAQTAMAAGADFVLFTEGMRQTDVHDISHTVAFSDFGMLPAICKRIAGV